MKCIGIIMLGALITAGTNSSHAQSSGNGSTQYYVSGGVSLMWRAPGDDRNIGTAAAYDLRYSTSPITTATFTSAAKAVSTPGPISAGATQACFVDRLTPGSVYYFAIKAVDEAGNWSAMSKVLAKSPQSYYVGDINSDTRIDIADIIYLVNYVFNNGAEPLPWGAGDANCDGKVGVGDISYMVNYVFQDGPVPGTNCP